MNFIDKRSDFSGAKRNASMRSEIVSCLMASFLRSFSSLECFICLPGTLPIKCLSKLTTKVFLTSFQNERIFCIWWAIGQTSWCRPNYLGNIIEFWGYPYNGLVSHPLWGRGSRECSSQNSWHLCLKGSIFSTRRIFAFTRALCLGETLVLLDVVSQGFFGNDGLSCNCFCIGMLKMQG